MDIAGDIGGTHTRLALFDPDTARPVAVEVYIEPRPRRPRGDAARVPARPPAPTSSGRASASPARSRDGHVQTTNLAVAGRRGAASRAVLGLDRVGLVNDLVANAYGIAELGPGRRRHAARGRPVDRRQRRGDLGRHGPRRGRALLGRIAPPRVRERGRPHRLRPAQRRGGRAARAPGAAASARELRAGVLGDGARGDPRVPGRRRRGHGVRRSPRPRSRAAMPGRSARST